MSRYDQQVSSLVMEYEPWWTMIQRCAPYRQIAAILRGRIERGEYQAGQRLPGINDLDAGIRRGPDLTANKALRLLVTEGLAELSPGRGFYVTPPPEDAS